jgi:FMN reductase (NADPH)
MNLEAFMENPTIALIRAHGSVRKYLPEPVPDSVLATLLMAAQQASTSSNLQAWSVIAITDPTKRQRLAELCGNQAHIAQAPLFLTWCADLARMDKVCELRGYTQEAAYVENFLIAAIDVAVTAQNAALAAESIGLGICYIGSIRNNPAEVIKLLGLPQHVFPITGMTIGYPAQPPRIRPRLPLNAVLHHEKYNPDQDEALFQYDKTMAKTGIYDQRQVHVPGRPDIMEDYGWMEHTARRVSKAMRVELREILKSQGFELK